MFNDNVAQNPIIPVSAGKKHLQNCPAFTPPTSKADDWERMDPNPPASRYAHPNSTNPSVISSGALMFNKTRIVSIPR
jgi:hypothetical protein